MSPEAASAFAGKIPIRTHVVSERDDIVELACRYTEGIAGPGDVICLAETVVAITQGRAILPETIRPGLLARFLSLFPGKDGSLATPPAMQLAVEEVGRGRIILGALAAAVGKAVGKKGLFYIVAGRKIAFIDDIAGTMFPYEKHIVLGPRDPDRVVQAIKAATGAEAVIADVNDIKKVDLIGRTCPELDEEVMAALRDNPFGNDDEQTPIVVLKRSASGGLATA